MASSEISVTSDNSSQELVSLHPIADDKIRYSESTISTSSDSHHLGRECDSDDVGYRGNNNLIFLNESSLCSPISSEHLMSVPNMGDHVIPPTSLSRHSSISSTTAGVNTNNHPGMPSIDRHTMEQLEFYRDHYLAAMKQVELSAHECTSIRNKYTDITNENVRLQHHNHHLEKRLSRTDDTRKMSTSSDSQDIQSRNGSSGNSSPAAVSSNTVRCSFATECSDWKQKFDAAYIEIEVHRKEMERYKRHCDDLSRDRNSLALEKDELKQQLSIALREKSMYHLDMKEMNKVIQSRADELRRLSAQRNAAEHELRTILAERKSVLEENQKLSDDLALARDEHQKEDRNHRMEIDGLRHELIVERQFHEDIVAECSLLREQLSRVDKQFDVNTASASSRESNLVDIEILRKQLERAHADTQKAVAETDVAKSRRDWAISEREKIVLERDSVKYLCDELRKERDTAISELLAAIRDSEKIKKQKDEACQELEFLRDKSENEFSSEGGKWPAVADSRFFPNGCFVNKIDMDADATDIIVIELDLIEKQLSKTDKISASCDDRQHSSICFGITLGSRRFEKNDTQSDYGGVVVIKVDPSSPAFGRLKPNDYIVQINQYDCTGTSKHSVIEMLRNAKSQNCTNCRIVVRRPRAFAIADRTHMYAVKIRTEGGLHSHGIGVETGIYIASVAPNSIAARQCPEMIIGERILSINNHSMDTIRSANEAMSLLNDNRVETLSIVLLKRDSFAGKSRKMYNSSTQTEVRMSPSETQIAAEVIDNSEVSNKAYGTSLTQTSKSSSKISEMINKFKGKMHITSTTLVSNKSSNRNVPDIENMYLEQDALQVLDSVLNMASTSQPSTVSVSKSKENLLKRSKRVSKKDQAEDKPNNKNVGTWPRSNTMISSTFTASSSPGSEMYHAGTVVQHRKKQRPALSFFTGPLNIDREKKEKKSHSQKVAPIPLGREFMHQNNYFQAAHTQNASDDKNKSIRNTQSAIPFVHIPPPPPSSIIMNRHSICATNADVTSKTRDIIHLQHLPQIGASNTLSRIQKTHDRYNLLQGINVGSEKSSHNHHSSKRNSNRYSLNISNVPTYEMNKVSDATINSNHIQPSNTMHLQKSSNDHIISSMASSKSSVDSFGSPMLHTHATITSKTLKRMPIIGADKQIESAIRDTTDAGLDICHSSICPSDSDSIVDALPINHHSSQSKQRSNRIGHMQMRGSSVQPISAAFSQRQSSPLTLFTPNITSNKTISNENYDLDISRESPHELNDMYISGQTNSDMSGHSGSNNMIRSNKSPSSLLQSMYISSRNNDDHHSRDAFYRANQNVQNVSSYEGGTYPRKKENQRFRIPSNPSVATSKITSGIGICVKNSTGSIEHQGSDRSSPMPPAFHVEVLSHGMQKRNSLPDYCFGQKPNPGDLRRVTIDKSVELGITITCNIGGGIFVSSVAENSIASQVGLQIGDQLLEVCGINMRNATYELAANVLRQCGNSISMLVQYSPEKYDQNARPPRSSEDEITCRSDSPTPRNSPRISRSIRMGMGIFPPDNKSLQSKSIISKNQLMKHDQKELQSIDINNDNLSSTENSQILNSMSRSENDTNNRPISIMSTHRKVVHGSLPISTRKSDNLDKPSATSLISDHSEINSMDMNSVIFDAGHIMSNSEGPRRLTITTRKNTNLGISLMGGNAVGIFVHDVQAGSLADAAGMRMGDQILEYNGANLRRVTAEQAANEISRPAETVTIVAHHNMKKFNEIKDEAGDSLYIRVGFDRSGDLGEGDLRFVKDDVLYVDTTIFRGVFGQWRAWKLDEYGHRLECGIIPSQLKVEEELRLLNDITGESDGSSRRGSTSTRRSFFRRKKHPRSSSRDSKEVASFSNTQLSWFSDSGMLLEEGTILSYQRVERLDYTICRPVLIIGPLADCVADKLCIDFPLVFERCKHTALNISPEALEKGLEDNHFIDYRKRGSMYDCTMVQTIRDIGNRNHHCILDVCISAVDRLHRLQIYPIVLLLRFKSAKQIREIKDSRYSTDKISAKAAKEMYEHTLKLEADYKQFISAVIPAGVNITHMSTQIKAAVDEEQTKVLWVPL